MKKLAPVLLFVYNRPAHTLQTLEALEANELSAASILYIYADGPKENDSVANLDSIKETRKVIRKRKWCSQVYIIESEVNKGLANSVIDATTTIVNSYGTVITLEDDVIVGKYFLQFMNQSLSRYSDCKNVFMVSGYFFSISGIKHSNSAFFLPLTTTQAWATWKRAWDVFDPLALGYEKLKTNAPLRKAFNLDDSYDYTSMLIHQMEGQDISSWAIRYWWTMFNLKGVVLYPDQSMIKNIGWDGSGVHSGNMNPYLNTHWDENYKIDNYPKYATIDFQKFRQLKSYLKQTNGTNTKSKIVKPSTILKKLYSVLTKYKKNASAEI